LLIVVQVIGQNHYDRGSGDAHKKSELRDIEAPTHIAAESGDGQTMRQLQDIAERTRQNHKEKRGNQSQYLRLPVNALRT